MLALARRLRLIAICAIASLGMLGGCASTGTGDPRDPLEPLNRGIFKFNDGVDTVLMKPVAEIYQGVVPPLVQTGVSNVFANLNDVVVALNNLLQGKFTEALSDAGRVVLNTTAGLFGIFDMATLAGLERHDEDFGQTLGWWGVGDGPYLVLPFLGPSNVRDAFGKIVDWETDPTTFIDPNRDRNAIQGFRLVTRRAELLSASRLLTIAAIDEYEFLRDAYLQRRRNLIHDGNPPRERDDGANAAPLPAVDPRTGDPTRHASSRPGGTASAPAIDEATRNQPEPISELTGMATDPDAATEGPQPLVRVWLTNPR